MNGGNRREMYSRAIASSPVMRLLSAFFSSSIEVAVTTVQETAPLGKLSIAGLSELDDVDDTPTGNFSRDSCQL